MPNMSKPINKQMIHAGYRNIGFILRSHSLTAIRCCSFHGPVSRVIAMTMLLVTPILSQPMGEKSSRVSCNITRKQKPLHSSLLSPTHHSCHVQSHDRPCQLKASAWHHPAAGRPGVDNIHSSSALNPCRVFITAISIRVVTDG